MEEMLSVFASGSCRLLSILRRGHELVHPIHSMNSGTHHDDGINFLGKLHNVKQHIQFVRFIKGAITIPEHILSRFLLCYSDTYPKGESVCAERLECLQEQIIHCDRYIFEICSLNIYEYEGYQLQHELFQDAPKNMFDNKLVEYQQTTDDLYRDLESLCELLPSTKPIIFVCHFRHNIIWDDPEKAVPKRELIYQTLSTLEKKYPNVYLYDPSLFLSNHREYYDGDNHYYDRYAKEIFTGMYETILKDTFHLKKNNPID